MNSEPTSIPRRGFFLAEFEDGEYKLNRNPKQFAPVKDYLKKQGRFKHMQDADMEVVIANRDKKWSRMRKHWL